MNQDFTKPTIEQIQERLLRGGIQYTESFQNGCWYVDDGACYSGENRQDVWNAVSLNYPEKFCWRYVIVNPETRTAKMYSTRMMTEADVMETIRNVNNSYLIGRYE